jgi:multisubunit Na+/H+ antiporter MnhC subunit
MSQTERAQGSIGLVLLLVGGIVSFIVPLLYGLGELSRSSGRLPLILGLAAIVIGTGLCVRLVIFDS